MVLCGVVELELLQGLREGERKALETALSALEFVPTSGKTFKRPVSCWAAYGGAA